MKDSRREHLLRIINEEIDALADSRNHLMAGIATDPQFHGEIDEDTLANIIGSAHPLVKAAEDLQRELEHDAIAESIPG